MTTAIKPSIHGRLTELADPTRCRLLLALEQHELTVGELCSVVQLPQSTVSRHLRILSDEGWVASRAEGASRWYRIAPGLDDDAVALWALVRRSLADTSSTDQDRARLEAVITQRRTQSAAFFADAAPQWDEMRTALFGARADLAAALALLEPSLVVGDLGCGTGVLSAALAPHVAHVHAIDASPAMLDTARVRLGNASNVTIAAGSLESLPLPDDSLDAAIMLLVLHHVVQPTQVLTEVRRVLRPGGRLLIADMRRHGREEYRQQMGHLWLGFEPEELTAWAADAGFRRTRYVPLPVDAAASGPAMFTFVAS